MGSVSRLFSFAKKSVRKYRNSKRKRGPEAIRLARQHRVEKRSHHTSNAIAKQMDLAIKQGRGILMNIANNMNRNDPMYANIQNDPIFKPKKSHTPFAAKRKEIDINNARKRAQQYKELMGGR